MTSTTAADASARAVRHPARHPARPVLVVLFWLGVWQLAAMAVSQPILLASPVSVVRRLAELVVTAGFWGSVAQSLLHVVAGFATAVVLGCVTGSLAAWSRTVDALVTPLLAAVRATPVVSFIVLALVWGGSGRLAFTVSALMVLPVIHPAVLAGVRSRDERLLQMAAVFEVPLRRRAWAIDVPAVLALLAPACGVGVGLAWKSGVAAEVIGLPAGSIGERIYDAKLYLSTPDLFAWTAVVIALSLVVERAVARVVALVNTRLSTPSSPTPWLAGRETWPQRRPASRGLPAPRVEVRGLVVTYGEVIALDGASADLAAGRITALQGPNGAGKTTLAHAILGLVGPASGAIVGAAGVRRAAAFQDERLCEHLDAVENVRLAAGREATRAGVERDLAAVGLGPASLRRPVRELSGGQRRRVGLVRALAGAASLVVLDEPFAGMDAAGHAAALTYVRSRSAGRTVLLVTHDPADALTLDAEAIVLRDHLAAHDASAESD